MNRQEAGVEQETSGQEEVRDKGITSAAAEVLLFQLPTKSSPGALVRTQESTGFLKRKAHLIVVAFIGLHLDPVGNVVLGHARGDRGERGDESREVPHHAAQ